MELNIKDEHNPQFLFQSVSEKLLVKIARGEINAIDLAKEELRNRGLDENGEWHRENYKKSFSDMTEEEFNKDWKKQTYNKVSL
tara:strand:+ start:252 stop:503 length:252 start_codon:yes stop_codon:yes gene_type:complete